MQNTENSRKAFTTPGSPGGTSSSGGRPSSRDLFNTEHLDQGLARRSLHGGFTTGASQVLRFGLYMAATVVLARLVTAEEFGLVAMVGTLVSFQRMAGDAGLSTATIQRQALTNAQASNLFWINLLAGVASMLLGFALAPGAAWFFRDERLVGITIALSTMFVPKGLAVQHLSLMNRQMKFTALAIVDVGSMALGLVVGVAMAYSGLGYWSLVGMQLAVAVGEMALAMAYTRWIPGWFTRNSDTRAMLRFGASLTSSALLRRVSESLAMILIGRFLGPVASGYYSRATALLMRPMNQFIAPFSKVMLPLLSRLQDQPIRYREAFLRVDGFIAFSSASIAGLLVGLSGPIVLTLLGPAWVEVIPIFAALSLAALYIPSGFSSMWLLTSQGRTRDIFTLGWIFAIIAIVSAIVGLPFGLSGIALSISLFGIFIRLPVQFHIIGRSGPVSVGDLWRAWAKRIPTALATGGAAFLSARILPSDNPLLQLSVGLAAGLIATGVVVLLSPDQRNELHSVLALLRSRTKSTAVAS